MPNPESRPRARQNSWVNFGKHIRRADGTIPQPGEPDYLHPKDRPYAEQKIGILPEHVHPPHPYSQEKLSRILGILERFAIPYGLRELPKGTKEESLPFADPAPFGGYSLMEKAHTAPGLESQHDDAGRHIPAFKKPSIPIGRGPFTKTPEEQRLHSRLPTDGVVFRGADKPQAAIAENVMAAKALRAMGLPVGDARYGNELLQRHLEGASHLIANHPQSPVVAAYLNELANPSKIDLGRLQAASVDLMNETRAKNPWLSIYDRLAEKQSAIPSAPTMPKAAPEPEPHQPLFWPDAPLLAQPDFVLPTPKPVGESKPLPMAGSASSQSPVERQRRMDLLNKLWQTKASPEVMREAMQKELLLTPEQAARATRNFMKKMSERGVKMRREGRPELFAPPISDRLRQWFRDNFTLDPNKSGNGYHPANPGAVGGGGNMPSHSAGAFPRQQPVPSPSQIVEPERRTIRSPKPTEREMSPSEWATKQTEDKMRESERRRREAEVKNLPSPGLPPPATPQPPERGPTPREVAPPPAPAEVTVMPREVKPQPTPPNPAAAPKQGMVWGQEPKWGPKPVDPIPFGPRPGQPIGSTGNPRVSVPTNLNPAAMQAASAQSAAGKKPTVSPIASQPIFGNAAEMPTLSKPQAAAPSGPTIARPTSGKWGVATTYVPDRYVAPQPKPKPGPAPVVPHGAPLQQGTAAGAVMGGLGAVGAGGGVAGSLPPAPPINRQAQRQEFWDKTSPTVRADLLRKAPDTWTPHHEASKTQPTASANPGFGNASTLMPATAIGGGLSAASTKAPKPPAVPTMPANNEPKPPAEPKKFGGRGESGGVERLAAAFAKRLPKRKRRVKL